MKTVDTNDIFTDYILKAIQEESKMADDQNRLISTNSSNESKSSCVESDTLDSVDSVSSLDITFQKSRVLLGTADSFYLNADDGAMLAEIKEDDANLPQYVFQRMELKGNDIGKDGKLMEVDIVVFQLEIDPTCFLAVTPDKRAIIQVYQSEFVPDCSCPDERFFKLHQKAGDQKICMLESFVERGSYLHHMDDKIYLRPLDFNQRPPEEYVFVCEKYSTRKHKQKSTSSLFSCTRGIKSLFHRRCLGYSDNNEITMKPQR